MANYSSYTIKKVSFNSSYIRFELNGYVPFSGGSQDYIYCATTINNRSSIFNSYQVGDQVEIDLERTRKESGSSWIYSESMVRPTVSSSSRQLIRQAQISGESRGGRITGNQFTGERREEHLNYNNYTGDYYYEYIEYTKK